MNKTLAALAATVLAASLAACSGNTVQQPTESQTVTPPPTQSVAPPTIDAPAATSEAPRRDVAAFGGSVTFPDGVKVSVSQPTAVPADQYAYGAVEGKIVTFNVSVTNGSKQPLAAGMLAFPRVTYGAEGAQAQTATSITQNIGNGSLGTILPGETQSMQTGFGVPSSGFSALRVEVASPAFGDLPAVFKGEVK